MTPRSIRRRPRALAWALALLLSACGGGGGGGAPVTLQSIAVTPDSTSVLVSGTKQFTATGHYSNGSTKDLTSFATWSSGTTTVATITSTGVATGVAVGESVITATRGSVSGHTTLGVAEPVSGNATVWDFSDASDRLAAASGTATLGYRDPGSTGWGPASTQFARASALGLPLINGEDPLVMGFPATTPEQGYVVTHNANPNGVYEAQGLISNYTLVFDIYWPANGADYRSILQTDTANADDGDMFMHDVGGGKIGVGVDNVYNHYAAISPGSWHRIVIVEQCAINDGGSGQQHRYIDGLFVSGDNTSEGNPLAPRCRWALDPTFFLFTDNDGETSPGYVSSMMFVDRILAPAEIAALGGPNASGANVPGMPAPPPPVMADRRVLVFAHRTHSGRSPENTVEGITQAFDESHADHVECDIRWTSDGKVALMHDPQVDRTTTGTGNIADIALATLQTYDAGSWWDPSYSGVRVPTLTQALNAAKGKGRLLLDVKLTDMGPGIQASLAAAGVDASAVYPSMGTSDTGTKSITDNVPGAEILWGAAPGTLDAAGFQALKDKGVVGFDMPFYEIDTTFTDAARANGMYPIVAYTILDPDTMLDMIAKGVDGMETDYPAVLDSLMPPAP